MTEKYDLDVMLEEITMDEKVNSERRRTKLSQKEISELMETEKAENDR